ncbi:MAG TPA: GNAT family N-acetyltransferase [candidate division Zixibacteria bacterium]|nr:GNAT family N-acetyltransferase [candidate division Zixibacteria bacterium]
MTAYTTRETRDRTRLAEFFRSDPILYAYKLGDLDPFFFDNTRWWIAERDGAIAAAALLYTAFATPVIQALTDNQAQAGLWRELADTLPDGAHTHYRATHQEAIHERWRIDPIGLMHKMRWTGKPRASAAAPDTAAVKTLTPEDNAAIQRLQARAYPGSYFDRRLLEPGLCVGVFDGQRLLSFGACHVFSLEYRIAALGAIMTDPDFRGRGLAAAITQSLLERMRAAGVNVTLNVHSENSAAIHLYEKLGFVKHCEYREATLWKM